MSTKSEEDLSLGNMNQLLAALTTCMLTFSALEVAFYFIYNKMVNRDMLSIISFNFLILQFLLLYSFIHGARL